MRRWWWLPWHRRWEALIVGDESGQRTPVSFLRFRRRADAEHWVALANLRSDFAHFTHWEIHDRAEGEP